MNAKNISLENYYFKILLVGAPKTGKTHFIGTFDKPSYVFDFDDGMLTVLGKDIEFDTFQDSNLMQPLAFTLAQKKLIEIQNTLKSENKLRVNNKEVFLISVDGSTMLQEVIMNRVLFQKGRAGQMPQIGEMGSNDYSAVRVEYQNFISQIVALPCHIIIVCHDEPEKDQVTGAISVKPALIGRLSTTIGGRFDFVFRTEVVGGKPLKYRLQTRCLGAYEAGTRAAWLDVHEEADLKVLFSKFAAYKKSLEGKENDNKTCIP
jgi:hypothetical protein